MSLKTAGCGGRGGEHCFWKQVHLLSPVKLIGLVNREEERGNEEREGSGDGQMQSRLAHAWINSVRDLKSN